VRRDPQQLAQRRGEPDLRNRHLDLDRAGVAVGDPHVRIEVPEHVHHRLVGGEHERGEALDPFLTGTRAQGLEQEGPQPPSLPVIDHGHGDLGGVGTAGVAHVARHSKPLAVCLVGRDDRLVVVVIDLGQIAHHVRAELPGRHQEAPVARLRAEPLKAAQQQLAVLGAAARSQADARPVAQLDRRPAQAELIGARHRRCRCASRHARRQLCSSRTVRHR
jgi:hypothetical protein